MKEKTNKRNRILFLNEDYFQPKPQLIEHDTHRSPLYFDPISIYSQMDYDFDMSLMESGHELNRYDNFITNIFINKCLTNKKIQFNAFYGKPKNHLLEGTYCGYAYDYNDDDFIEIDEQECSKTQCPLYVAITPKNNAYSYAAMIQRICDDNDNNWIQLWINETTFAKPRYLFNSLKHEFVHLRQSFIHPNNRNEVIPTNNFLLYRKNQTYQNLFLPNGISNDLRKQITEYLMCLSEAENYAYTTQCIDYVRMKKIKDIRQLYIKCNSNIEKLIYALIREFPFSHFKRLDEISSIFDPGNINTSDDFVLAFVIMVCIDNLGLNKIDILREGTEENYQKMSKTLNDAINGEFPSEEIKSYNGTFVQLMYWSMSLVRTRMWRLQTGIYIALDNMGFLDEIKNNEYNEQT